MAIYSTFFSTTPEDLRLSFPGWKLPRSQAVTREVTDLLGERCTIETREPEWEYACRAGTRGRFYSGTSVDHLKAFANLQDQSLYALRPRFSNSDTASYLRKPVSWDDGHPFSAPVGSYQPNAFGLYDMLGNAAEWCRDWHGKSYYRSSPISDPLGPDKVDEGRIVRGGAFLHQPQYCRVTWRIGGTPTYHNYIIGFRVVAKVARDAPNLP